MLARLLVVLLLPQQCMAYVTWGDFHVFAVIFFSFLGGFLGLGAIFAVIWFACLKPLFDRHKEEVEQTHREHHPWPVGSARWHIQQMLKTGRSRTSETRFSPTKKTAGDYENVARLAQATSVGEYPHRFESDQIPIIRTEYIATPSRASTIVDRPTYFTPSPDKPMMPVLREEIEEVQLMREESIISRGSADGDRTTGAAGSSVSDRIVRTTTTRHSQRTLQPATYI